MVIDTQILGDKLRRCREQLQLSPQELAALSGIEQRVLAAYERGGAVPSGDELLVLADVFRIDYKFFLSNQKRAPFEQTESLCRRLGSEFSKADRWSVQEFLFLAECEAFMESELDVQHQGFSFIKHGKFFKGHGEDAALKLRAFLGYDHRTTQPDVFKEFRRIGIRVFRRHLRNSNISGLFLRHPVAGPCVLINYSEDFYRQRFTAAHEAGHAILDEGDEIVVSFRAANDLQEIRANAFASHFLLPRDLLEKIPGVKTWTQAKAIEYARSFRVSTDALAVALSRSQLIGDEANAIIRSATVPAADKIDPELGSGLSTKGRERKRFLLEQGLSDHYVGLTFEAYRRHRISAGRAEEILLCDSEAALREIAEQFGEVLHYGS